MEDNPFVKRWRKGLRRIALVYPNAYSSGVANIGLQFIYAYLNSLENVICERFYLDVHNCLRSFESGTPLKDFDVALFSLQFEEDYFNVVKILKAFKGLKIAGGPCAMINPMPISKYFDAFVIGEVENSVVLDIIAEAKSVEDLKCEGIWLKEGRVKRIYPKKLDFYLRRQIIADNVFGRCLILEIGRGCVRRCRFCVVRQIYSPLRWRDTKLLIETAEDYRGVVDKICLVAPSTLDHPKAKELIAQLIDIGFLVSPSSTRADKLDEETLELLVMGGLRSLTIAPEVGSDKLRDLLNKGLSEEHIINAVEIGREKGIKGFKLYFMIGLPNESFEDVKEIVKLVEKVRSLKVEVSVSINPFVPKPHTPLQWTPYTGIENVEEGLKEIKRRRDYLIKELSKVCEVNVESVERFAIQTVLSRGNEDVSKLLEAKPSLRLAKKMNLTRFLNKIPLDSELPWDFIDHGYKKERLIDEFIRAVGSE
ncbi:radical SAM protein [Archaeoglobus sp.]